MKINYFLSLSLAALLLFANLFKDSQEEFQISTYPQGFTAHANSEEKNPGLTLPPSQSPHIPPTHLAEMTPDMTNPATEHVEMTARTASSSEYTAVASAASTAAFDYTLGEARLTGGSGSLQQETELSINGLDTSYLPPLDAGMINVTGNYGFYRMLPHGTKFNKDIHLTLPYNTKLLPRGFSPKDIHTYYYNDTLQRWIAIQRDSVDMENRLIVSSVNHFTDFINAVIKVPEMPETEAFVPTMMNDMKPADPMAGIQLMQPPTPNNNGSANLSYPLQIPAGRQGIQPNLAVAYNSSGGNGWMGLGWDLSIPAITIETRWGVPHYDAQKESETYLYNGQQLATKNAEGEYDSLSYRALWKDRQSGNVQFYPYTEGAFEKIIRHGSSPKNYWWEVRDKTGTIYYYGKKLYTDTFDPAAVFTDGNGNIARWGLTEVRDLHDNFAYYQYEKITKEGKGSSMYIKQITYTGHGTEEGKYKVYFHRLPRIDLDKFDVITNARSGALELTDDLLERVIVTYQDTVVGGYKFCYNPGNFEKSLLCSMEALLSEYLGTSLNAALTADMPCYCVHPNCTHNPSNRAGIVFFKYHQIKSTFSDGVTIKTGGKNEVAEGKASPTSSVSPTSLGGTTSSGFSAGGAGTIGIGKDLSKKGLTLGGNFQYGISESEGLLTMLDIDGDGLPDKFYKVGNGLYYRKQIFNADSNRYEFSDPIAIVVSGSGAKNSFLRDASENSSWGLEANASIKGFGIVGADSWNWTKSSSSFYMNDVDADGMPDLIQDGYVFFNRGIVGNEHQFVLNTSSTVMVGGNCGGKFIYQDEGINEGMYTPGNVVSTTICHTDTIRKITKNLIKNGDFEMGNTGFTSDYTYLTNGPIFYQGLLYSIVRNLNQLEPNAYPLDDAELGSNGHYLVAHGNNQNKIIWKQTVPVTPKTLYTFEMIAATLMHNCSWEELGLRVDINGIQIGKKLNVPYILEWTGNGNQLIEKPWRNFGATWYSGNNSTAVITIVDGGYSDDIGNHSSGNYIFGIDNLKFGTTKLECTTVCETINDTIKEHKKYMPDHDAVKVWIAPWSGWVSIFDTICLPTELAAKGKEFHVTDGVKASIQHKGEILWSQIITPDSPLCHTPSLGCYVDKGDRIYFRLESLNKRTYDQVRWNQRIVYSPPGQGPTPMNAMASSAIEDISSSSDMQMGTQALTLPMSCVTYSTEQYYNMLNADSKKIFTFDGREDFLINPAVKYQMPLDSTGTIKIESKYSVNKPLSEYIDLRMYHNGNIIANRNISQRTLTNGYTSFDVASLNIKQGDSIWFEIYSPTNVDWNAIDWKIKYHYTTSKQPNIVLFDPISVPGTIIPTVKNENVVPHCTNYPNPVFPVSYYLCDQNNSFTSLTFSIPGVPNNSRITFSIKNAAGNLFAQSTTVNNGLATINHGHTVNLLANTLYYFELFLNDTVSDNITQPTVKINNTNYKTGLSAQHKVKDLKFGDLYRNWGQFTYKKDSADGDAIVENRLKFSSKMNTVKTDFDGLDTTSTAKFQTSFKDKMKDQYDPLKENFLMMTPDYQYKRWVGYGNITYITADTLSNTYPFGTWVDETEFPVPQIKHNAPVQAPRKHTFNDGESPGFSAMASVISAGKAWPTGTSSVLSEYMDMNGDRYPDNVSEYAVQYSKPQGGLFKYAVGKGIFAYGIEYSNYNGTSRNFGATFPIVSKKYEIKRSNSHIELGGNAGVSGSEGSSTDEGVFIWTDVNGDGLPDKLFSNGYVLYNLGYSYQPGTQLDKLNSIKKGTSISAGGSISASGSIKDLPNADQFDLGGASISGGFGSSVNTNQSNVMFIDITGDGLPDKVWSDNNGNMSMDYNTGLGFRNYDLSGIPKNAYPMLSESISGNINGAFSFGFPIPIPFVTLKLMVNPQGGKNWGVNRTKGQFIDMNGDGLPDYVTSNEQDAITVYYNQTGKANLLKEVRQIQMNFTIDYELSQNNYDSPQRFWVMNGVGVETPIYDNYTAYQYENPRYDRYEREQLGFEKVTTQVATGNGARKYNVTEWYHNTDLMRKGLKYRELMTDAAGNEYVQKDYTYSLAEIATGNFIYSGWEFCFGTGYPALASESIVWGDGYWGLGYMNSIKYYAYGPYGNAIEINDAGNISNQTDDVVSHISYHIDNLGLNLVGIATSYSESDNMGINYRTIESTIDPKTGKTLKIIRKGEGNPEFDFKYDEYGNRIQFTKPQNKKGERMKFSYEYDPILLTYPVKISNNLGYVTTAGYDYRWGLPVFKTDINGQTINFKYDQRGRLTQVKAPEDPLYSIRCFYSYDGELPSDIDPAFPAARTDRYDVQHPNNPLTTVSVAYGPGFVQTKINAEVEGNEMYVVSGKVETDYKGRVIRQWAPTTETGISYDYSAAKDAEPPVEKEYDILDRVTRMMTPDSSVTKTKYFFGNDYFGIDCFMTSVTDGRGNTTHAYTDTRGNNLQIIDAQGGKTRFQFNIWNELLRSIDPEDISTTYEYDNLGRQISRTHTNAGTDKFVYDQAGNLVKRQTQNLRDSSNKWIEYDYNYNQLKKITYPDHPENNVTYEYGAPGASYNQIGRLARMEDASGFHEYFYGNMGEITKDISTFVTPNDSMSSTFVMQYQYDTWNRMQNMTYPDGEKVSYVYNTGGQLYSMAGSQSYINSILYDRFGNRTSIEYGNRTFSYYQYDNMQRLKHMSTIDNSQVLQDIWYGFDEVGNIKVMLNFAEATNSGLGGRYEEYYEYNNLNRLKHAGGNLSNGSLNDPGYELWIEFSPNGKIKQKNLYSEKVLDGMISKDKYENNYKYKNDRLEEVINLKDTTFITHFKWDLNGNMVNWVDSNREVRNHCWDEENRLMGVSDMKNGQYAQFIYDASGERTYKISGKSELHNQTGKDQYMITFENPTLYTSPYLVATQKGYTKHYYAGSQRVLSRLGTGSIKDVDYGDQTYGHGRCLSKREQLRQRHDSTCTDVKPYWDNKNLLSSYIRGYGSSSTPDESYFYHTDHLGSSSWITNKYGKHVQYLKYLPFGEPQIDQRTTGWNSMYTFSGKEKDEETGYSYFGARYYWDNLSIWLSVDPLADKYPHLNGYNYCAGNPLRFIDPTGMEIDDSQMSPSEKKIYQERIKTMKERSELFNTMYTSLEGSKDKYTVGFGERGEGEDGAGKFISNMNGGGSVTLFASSEEEIVRIATVGISEEFFHAYQHDNRDGYAKGAFNTEFEAKAFSLAVTMQAGGGNNFRGMNGFRNQLFNNNFGDEKQPIYPEIVNSSSFLGTYTKAANNFAAYNRANNIGNEFYRQNTKVAPFSLQKVINDTYRK